MKETFIILIISFLAGFTLATMAKNDMKVCQLSHSFDTCHAMFNP